MKIAHVVTYVSPDGAYGGPSRVALAQAAALAGRGHEVTVLAAGPVDRPERREQDGYQLVVFPAKYVFRRLGFAGLRAPGMCGELKKLAATLDVAHVHLARDLVTLPATRIFRKRRVPFVVQTHGMIDESTKFLAKPVDLIATRPALHAASAVLVLTDDEELDLRSIDPERIVARVRNGIRIREDVSIKPDEPRMVLFLARMHARKRPIAFVEMAEIVADRVPGVSFVLAGPDEGEGQALTTAIESSRHKTRIRWVGPVNPADTDALIESATVYVLPAVGEVFPMSIVEAFNLGTPVVTTRSLGMADDCERYGSAALTDGSPAELALAVERLLLSSHERSIQAKHAQTHLRAELDIDDVAQQIETIYAMAAGCVNAI